MGDDRALHAWSRIVLEPPWEGPSRSIGGWVAAAAAGAVTGLGVTGRLWVAGIMGSLPLFLAGFERDEDDSDPRAPRFRRRAHRRALEVDGLGGIGDGRYVRLRGRVTREEGEDRVLHRTLRGSYRRVVGHELRWPFGGKRVEVATKLSRQLSFTYEMSRPMLVALEDGTRVRLDTRHACVALGEGRERYIDARMMSELLEDSPHPATAEQIRSAWALEWELVDGDLVDVCGWKGAELDPAGRRGYREAALRPTLEGNAQLPLFLTRAQP